MDVSGGLCYGCVRVVADGLFIWQRIGFVLCLMQYNVRGTRSGSRRVQLHVMLPLPEIVVRAKVGQQADSQCLRSSVYSPQGHRMRPCHRPSRLAGAIYRE